MDIKFNCLSIKESLQMFVFKSQNIRALFLEMHFQCFLINKKKMSRTRTFSLLILIRQLRVNMDTIASSH